MALVAGTDPLSLSFTFIDNNSSRATTSLYLPVGTTIDGINDAVALFRDPLVALTNARLVGASATITYTEDAPVPATPESEVERKLVLIFNTTSRRQKVRVEVPSPVFDIETLGTNAVNVAEPRVLALVQAITQGAIGPNNGARSIANLDITSLSRAYIAHRSRTV